MRFATLPQEGLFQQGPHDRQIRIATDDLLWEIQQAAMQLGDQRIPGFDIDPRESRIPHASEVDYWAVTMTTWIAEQEADQIWRGTHRFVIVIHPDEQGDTPSFTVAGAPEHHRTPTAHSTVEEVVDAFLVWRQSLTIEPG